MEPSILSKLLAISDLLQRDMARAFAGTPLTDARVAVLWIVQTLGPSTQQAIAEALRMSARNVSAMVDVLESHGYVVRSPHPTDRRAVIVTLTPPAAEQMDAMQREHAELTETLLAAVAPEDRPAFQRGLDAIAGRLEELVNEDAAARDAAREGGAA
ncbi:MAG TPA: MarR family transcriptional regulator [Glaciibacter sp.]|nr:MarR family transcriptional regulator [Glaciibacter sp.]